MLRYDYPYNGKRYLANLNTGEIHDLLNEKPQCQINEIINFKMADTYTEALVTLGFHTSYLKPNGCHYCLPSEDKG
ncbi:hypothetical protein [Peptoniphilus indolicus]|uniref:3-hydroxyacyl-CoA dehydrogenase n=2 Tax=Peptoniphilus indolicus TaxID=33030 RepID=G4D5J9_9FIRM|nr:hypothetical protein [Peptoniphilus indolicus]EGY78665.1 3-hydroxyacyl-CoA dehydrogenase [Peptoniphilus indolicus ATCC 29427]SUB74418.1 Uncharacterised protein [Peptoniphilus indolicus]